MTEECTCTWCNQEIDATHVLVAVYDKQGNIVGREPVCWDCFDSWYW